VHRSLGYAAARGRRNVAALFPNTDFGQVQQAAFNATVAKIGLGVKANSVFGSISQAQSLIDQLGPQFGTGAVDVLFIPDRASAPGIGAMVQQGGGAAGRALIVGSADWDQDPAILAAPGLNGAIYPAVDDTGYRALRTEYTARFGSDPHPLATIAYTAVVLANAAPLAAGRYSAPLLTMPGGFNGRDGVFRFLADGRSQYALAIKQISNGVSQRIEGPKL
jgi:branched-chain amino acid transport system substrate-binding protein